MSVLPLFVGGKTDLSAHRPTAPAAATGHTWFKSVSVARDTLPPRSPLGCGHVRRGRTPVDERARHLLYRKLEAVLGLEEAGTLMDHLPPSGFATLATKEDLLVTREELRSEMAAMRSDLTAKIEQSARRIVKWTSSTVLAGLALAFAAGRFV